MRCWKSLLASRVRGSFVHLFFRGHSSVGSLDENVIVGLANRASGNVTRVLVIDRSLVCGVIQSTTYSVEVVTRFEIVLCRSSQARAIPRSYVQRLVRIVDLKWSTSVRYHKDFGREECAGGAEW